MTNCRTGINEIINCKIRTVSPKEISFCPVDACICNFNYVLSHDVTYIEGTDSFLIISHNLVC